MRTATSVLLAVVALGAIAAGLAGQPAAYVWAGLALLGLAGHLYAQHVQRAGQGSGGGLRTYSIVFAAVLVVVAVVLWVLAATGGHEHRGAYTGLAILWTFMATGAALLVIALERRRRAPRQDSRAEGPSRKG